MEVVFGNNRWSFDRDLTFSELIEKTQLGSVSPIVLVDGRFVEKDELISAKSRVLIIVAANVDHTGA
ncbi:MAG: hypothetical protein JW697_07650 [Kosmotogaceae bacterium]|nr:hypothetical protein [Kosmotogaceae bacterium]